jgi:undecaprenyl diphosphate synthase
VTGLAIDWTGLQPPAMNAGAVPKHVALVMDGNGRWANRRGLSRVEGHKAGEASLLDVVAGAIQIGVTHLSAYAFSTENWSRSPDEVRFLMGFNRDVIRRRRDQLHEWGVRVKWAGRIKPDRISEKTLQKHLYVPDLPDVDLFVRSSGEQRTSNFMMWQSAYAEMVFLDTLWPDFTREDLWHAIEIYAGRARRFGGAVDAPQA